MILAYKWYELGPISKKLDLVRVWVYLKFRIVNHIIKFYIYENLLKMLINLSKAEFLLEENKGLPEYYPTPPVNDEMLFYIQRNLNLNTVVYEINRLPEGRINEDFPLKIYWIKYALNGEKMGLNKFQNSMAYGYHSNKINNDLYQFELVSYNKLKFYLMREDQNQDFKVVTQINGRNSVLSNIYVFADELCLFPDVKYFELYGTDLESNLSNYQKINI